MGHVVGGKDTENVAFIGVPDEAAQLQDLSPAEQQGPGALKLWASSGQEEAAAVTVGSILSLLWFSMAVRTASLSVSGSRSSTWFSRRTRQLKDAWSTLLWSRKVSYCFNCSNRPIS